MSVGCGFGGARPSGVECDAPSDRLAAPESGAHMAETTQRNEHQLLIGGKWVDASEGTYEIVNPATEEIVGLAPNASADDALAAAAAAGRGPSPGGQPGRRRSAAPSCAGRRRHPGQIAELLPLVIAETRRDGDRRLAQQPSQRRRTARALRPRSASTARTAAAPPARAGDAAGARRDHRRDGQPATARRGCLHHPVQLPAGQHGGQGRPGTGGKGNTVVVKPAPQDPLAIVELVRILNDVGFLRRSSTSSTATVRPPPPARWSAPTRSTTVSFTGSAQGRCEDRRAGGPHHEAHAARARWQGRLRRLRGCRCEGGHRLHRVDLVLPLGADLHGADGGGRHATSSSRCATASCRWPAISRWATRPTPPPSSGP